MRTFRHRVRVLNLSIGRCKLLSKVISELLYRQRNSILDSFLSRGCHRTHTNCSVKHSKRPNGGDWLPIESNCTLQGFTRFTDESSAIVQNCNGPRANAGKRMLRSRFSPKRGMKNSKKKNLKRRHKRSPRF